MQTKARELYNQCKIQSLKKLWKTMLIPIIIVSVMLVGLMIYFSIKTDFVFGCLVFGSFLVAVLLSYLFIPFIFVKTPFKETIVDNMQIGAFIESSIGLGNNYAIIHLIVDGKDYFKQLNLRNYVHGDLIDIMELIRFFKNYHSDKKKRLNIATLSKTIKEKSISVVFDKYSNKLAICVDGKIIC